MFQLRRRRAREVSGDTKSANPSAAGTTGAPAAAAPARPSWGALRPLYGGISPLCMHFAFDDNEMELAYLQLAEKEGRYIACMALGRPMQVSVVLFALWDLVVRDDAAFDAVRLPLFAHKLFIVFIVFIGQRIAELGGRLAPFAALLPVFALP